MPPKCCQIDFFEHTLSSLSAWVTNSFCFCQGLDRWPAQIPVWHLKCHIYEIRRNKSKSLNMIVALKVLNGCITKKIRLELKGEACFVWEKKEKGYKLFEIPDIWNLTDRKERGSGKQNPWRSMDLKCGGVSGWCTNMWRHSEMCQEK